MHERWKNEIRADGKHAESRDALTFGEGLLSRHLRALLHELIGSERRV